MTYSTLKNSFVCALATTLFACSQDPNLHDPGDTVTQTAHEIVDLTQSPLFDQRRLIRSFSPSEIHEFNLIDHHFQLALFDGVIRDFRIDRVKVLERSGLSWFGSVDNDQYNYFSVTYRNGYAVGSALIDGISYSIRSNTNGRIELMQLNTHDDVDCDAEHELASMKGSR
jgi:hypothetical protein